MAADVLDVGRHQADLLGQVEIALQVDGGVRAPERVVGIPAGRAFGPHEIRDRQVSARPQHPAGVLEKRQTAGDVKDALYRRDPVEARVREGHGAGVANDPVDPVARMGRHPLPGHL